MWTAENQHWRFNHPGLQARWNLASPEDGLGDIQLNDKALPNIRILQCRNSSSAGEPEDFLVDHYIREDDLVATYIQTPKRANRKQIYLRRAGFLYGQSLTGMEIIFSMQTDRLDGDPQLQIRGELPISRLHALVNAAAPRWQTIETPSEALELPSSEFCGAFVTELADSKIIYAQIIDPSDFLGARLIKLSEETDVYSLSLPVFGSALEKGVIRRGRVTGLFFEADDALDQVLRFYQWYRESAPPLAT
jgi:hypothetical protein